MQIQNRAINPKYRHSNRKYLQNNFFNHFRVSRSFTEVSYSKSMCQFHTYQIKILSTPRTAHTHLCCSESYVNVL